MDPNVDHKFAQCATCTLFLKDQQLCAILGKNFKVLGTDTCGLYIPGGPLPEAEVPKPVKRVTPQEAGFLHEKVGCHHCGYFAEEDNDCLFFKSLNIPCKVNREGCCNNWTKIDKGESKTGTLKKFIR